MDGEKISTAGGLTSGTDLALSVVERYFGREAAQNAAVYMEDQGKAGSPNVIRPRYLQTQVTAHGLERWQPLDRELNVREPQRLWSLFVRRTALCLLVPPAAAGG